MCDSIDGNKNLTVVSTTPTAAILPSADDVGAAARASTKIVERQPEKNDACDIPVKKRKTRRGKSKRKHPYAKKVVRKPEAPHNSNQFLLEDHGNLEEIDENLKFDGVRDGSVTRTRDSSFSVDSEGDFYSSPDDEQQFLIKDFDDQYESVQAERLQSMSKAELIQEYLILEAKIEVLTERLYARRNNVDEEVVLNKHELQDEVRGLMLENESLRRENELLRNRKNDVNESTEDSETDSSDSCSSSSSSSCCSLDEQAANSRPTSPIIDYTKTNGHSAPSVETV